MDRGWEIESQEEEMKRQAVPRDREKTKAEGERVSLCTERGLRGSRKTLAIVSVVC